MWFKFCFLFLYLQITVLLAVDPIVLLPNGFIQGREDKTFIGKTYYSFKGIPYALPPVGERRFQPPQAVPEWEDIRVTQSFGNICYQTSSNSDNEDEDCLYANVFTPQLPNEENNVSLPVMFYIHGGGFVGGSADWFTPDLFINNDIVFVSINYRLGVFGFISTQDDVIPGNNGLKDQQFALRWAYDNIKLFGGNPDQITILGQSAGSASCAYQLLNQNNKGLIKGAILESGSFLSPWAFQRRARQIAFDTASILDSSFKTSNDSKSLLNFLLDVNARDLDGASEQYHNMEYGPQDIEISQGFYYAPVVEVKNPDAFLTKKMYGLLEAGNVVPVPIMIGVTSEENLSFNSDPNQFHNLMTQYDSNLDWIVPNDMQITDKDSKVSMGEKIRQLYTKGEPFAEHLGDALRFTSDTSFTRSVIKNAELFSNFADTYFYIFSYDGPMGQNNIYYDGAENVTHGEENLYLFCSGNGCDDSSYSEEDRTTRQRLVTLWSNFAKYQNPTPEDSDILQNLVWPPVQTENGDLIYLDIGENLELKNHPKEETYTGWNQLYSNLNFTDFDTY